MALLSIGHILSGYKNTVRHMRWMVLHGVVVVKEWRYVQFEFGVVTTLLGYISCCMPKLSQFIPKLFIYLSAKGIKICIAG
jgi:hypothetical protein